MTGTFHPSLQTMERYLDESLPDFEQAVLEDHLADCPDCREALQRMDALLFSGFTAESHAAAIAIEAVHADPLARALRAAQEAYVQHAGTLRGWLDSAAALWEASPSSRWGEQGVVPVRSQADTTVRVTLRAGESRATIYVHKTPLTIKVAIPGRGASLVVLFGKDPGFAVAVGTFQPGQEESSVVFDRVPEGEYYIAVAPPELVLPPRSE